MAGPILFVFLGSSSGCAHILDCKLTNSKVRFAITQMPIANLEPSTSGTHVQKKSSLMDCWDFLKASILGMTKSSRIILIIPSIACSR